jgi:hypothetical protein
VSIDQFHRGVLSQSCPTERQLEFYNSNLNGFSGTDKNEENLIATLVLGLYKARDWSVPHKFRKVFFAVPKSHEAWVLGTINTTLREAVLGQKAILSPKMYQGLREGVKNAVSNLSIGCRVLNISEPSEWIAYGFSKDESVTPEWIRAKLYTPPCDASP